MFSKPWPLSPSTRSSPLVGGFGMCFGGKVASRVRPMIMARRSASEMSLTAEVPRSRAVAQDRDTIGDLANLREPVRDVDDGRPADASFRTAVKRSSTESCDSGAVGSSRIRSRGETANALASSRRWRRATLSDETRSSRWPRKWTSSSSERIAFVGSGSRRRRCSAPDREADVLGDRHVREERRMLMDDRDPELLGHRRSQALDGRAVEGDRAARRAPSCPMQRSSASTCRRRSRRAAHAPRPGARRTRRR